MFPAPTTQDHTSHFSSCHSDSSRGTRGVGLGFLWVLRQDQRLLEPRYVTRSSLRVSPFPVEECEAARGQSSLALGRSTLAEHALPTCPGSLWAPGSGLPQTTPRTQLRPIYRTAPAPWDHSYFKSTDPVLRNENGSQSSQVVN